MKWIKMFGMSAIAAALLFGCSKTEEKKEEKEKEAILAVIQDNVTYAETEEVEKYMATMVIPEDSYEEVKASNQEIFDLFDIEYEILETEFLSLEEEVAVLRVKQKSIATHVPEGMTFNNSIVSANHTLVKVEGKWKIQTSEIDQETIELLDEK